VRAQFHFQLPHFLCIIDLKSLTLAFLAAINREALVPYTFSDGTHIPAGTHIRVPTSAIHRNESIYERADEFDGFRFAKLREREGEGNKHHFVTTGIDFLAFGHGQHSWCVSFSGYALVYN
jgi:cytochrome P450